MTQNEPGTSNVSINHGQVVAGNIGGSGNTGRFEGNVQFGSADADQLAETLTALRAELVQLRARIAREDTESVEPEDVDDVIEAVDSDEPDPSRVARRWRRLADLIPESLGNLDTIGRIVGLVEQLRNLAN
ncbi:hypothetical protein [Nocardia crassostreae]|uniref:hypothetical protein n=1 Tax=Nocardia crassostreae TaxID=53428 RepID=UPI000832FD9C|nr:hypothetical protein [Nocardia crassostreae]